MVFLKNNAVIFFTDNKERHSRLIEMLDLNSDLSLCTYSSESWTEIDFYSKRNVAFVMDEMPHTKESIWILSKLSEGGLFSEIPILFTNFDAMYEFEKSGFGAFAYDVFPEPFDYELTYRRFQNIAEIRQLKFQIFNLSQIHTKRILNQTNKLKEQSARMQAMNYDLVELLVAAIESRDLESGQHIKRIRFFTKVLTEAIAAECPEYNITKEQAEYIYYASSVHDIGKIAIPDAIMLKPGRLTEDEFEIMKTHTVRGYTLLNMLDGIDADNQYFKYCQEICHYHHERWDGRGYPEGLVGDDTPISAQIVAVCDCYDALTSSRPYKSALSHDEAVDLIMSGGCGQFSPKLMKCFGNVLSEFAKIESKFKSSDSLIVATTTAPVITKAKEIEAQSKFTKNEEAVLNGHDIIFEANVKKGYFNIVRGDWSLFYPYVPKNFTEAISQCLKICHPADAARFASKVNLEAFSELCKQGKTKTRVEFRIIKDDIEYLAVGFIIFETNNEKELIGLNGVFNVYDAEEMLADIKRGFGVTDSLTGLPLQKQFEIDVNSYIKDNLQSMDILILIDIDNMSACNHIFGYEYGNVLIKEFASKLRSVSSKDKIIGKASSDKFYMFVENITNYAETAIFIENLHKLLQKPYKTSNESGVFTASMGIARYPNDGKDFKSLAVAAEYAAKTAKTSGSTSYAFFNSSMQSLAAITANDSKNGYSSSVSKSDEPTFVPIVDAKTNKLVCYDYVSFACFDNGIVMSTEAFYDLNQKTKKSKNLDVLSIKSLLYSLIAQRDNGKKLPPISVYTMFSSEDLPSLLQELKTFTTENNCVNIDLCLLLPQAILEEMSDTRLKNLSDFLHKIGFKIGVYMIGARYLHNNCFNYGIFDRFVVKSEYIAHSIGSNGNMKYCADTLAILKKFVDVLSVPCNVSDYEKELVFNAGFSDFSFADTPVSGLNEMINDYRSRSKLVTSKNSQKTPIITEIDPAVAFFDILKSGLVWLFYDIKSKKVSVTSNASDVFGFNVFSDSDNNDTASVFKTVHPDDIPLVMEKIDYARMSLNVVSFEARLATGVAKAVYKTFRVTVICAVDASGKPVRFQVALSKKS